MGPPSTVAFLDLLQLSRGSYPDSLLVAPGPLRTVTLSDSLALGLGASPFVFSVREGISFPLEAPMEVTRDSGLAARDGGGAIIAGGGTTESRALVVVDENGVVAERSPLGGAARLRGRHVGRLLRGRWRHGGRRQGGVGSVLAAG